MSENGKPHFSFPCFTGAPVTLENVPGRAGGRPGAWLLLDASLFVEGVGEQLGMRGWGVGWDRGRGAPALFPCCLVGLSLLICLSGLGMRSGTRRERR